jgi:hypothetical protein
LARFSEWLTSWLHEGDTIPLVKRAIKTGIWVLAISLAVLLAGFALLVVSLLATHSERVIVMDKAGNPIPGAEVHPVTPNVDGNIVKTDSHGEAAVPLKVGFEPTHWVDVAASGYDVVQVPVPQSWPLRVTLDPAGTAKPVFAPTTQGILVPGPATPPP